MGLGSELGRRWLEQAHVHHEVEGEEVTHLTFGDVVLFVDEDK